MRNFTGLSLSLAVAVVAPAFAASEPPCPPAEGRKVQLTIVTEPGVEPVSLKIPRGYFDQRFIPADGSTRRAVLLRIDASDFGSWPRHIRPHQSEGPFLHYLLSTYKPLEEIAALRVINLLGYSYSDTPTFRDDPGPHGLSIFTAPPPPEPRKPSRVANYDVYVARNPQGHVTDTIRCRRSTKTPYTSCVHFIELGPLDLKLSYGTSLLGQWRDFSRKARALFACFSKP